jgi:hypothetical protein
VGCFENKAKKSVEFGKYMTLIARGNPFHLD